MLPTFIYERLPASCLVGGAVMLVHSPHLLSLMGGILLFIAGSLIWVMRSTRRRRDLVVYPNRRWLMPEWLYELRPFLCIAIALLSWRLSDQRELQLVLAILISWSLWCLFRRTLHRRPLPQRARPAR